MRISHRYKFVFIAYPRTGGTTVGRILDPYADIAGKHYSERASHDMFYDHMTAGEILQLFRQRQWDWNTYISFCFVRNPFERVLSLFYYRRKTARALDPRHRVMGNLNNLLLRILPAKSAFGYFLATQTSDNKAAANLKRFISSGEGIVIVDEILRFENFQDELIRLLKQVGIEMDAGHIPHLNANVPGINADRYYTDWARARVSEYYQYEIDRFGYTFPQPGIE